MKKKIIIIIILIISIISLSKYQISAKKSTDIYINYTTTNYEVLNKEINTYLTDYISNLRKDLNDINKAFTLNVNHNTFEYNNILSYVFYIESYTGGAHPNHIIHTINYDKQTNKIITIDNLICLNKNILNILSKISREKLLKDKRIVDTNMMLEGTKPTKDNFSNFAFSNDGLIIYFNYYQVAPYSQGEFEIIIPYSDINLSY